MTAKNEPSDTPSELLAQSIAAVPGVVGIYPTVTARISGGVRGAFGYLAGNFGGEEGQQAGADVVAVSGEGPARSVEVHIGTDAAYPAPDVARAVYEVIAAVVGREAAISVQVSRVEWSPPYSSSQLRSPNVQSA